MDYLVSTNQELSLDGYNRVSSLKEVVVVDSTSIIILNSFTEDEYRASLEITDLFRKRGVSKFIYITSTPLDSIRVLVESINGVFESDEELLEDIDEVTELKNYLEDNMLEVVESKVPEINSGFEVMHDFITKFEQGDSSLNDPLYLEVVNRAVNDIRKKVTLQEDRTSIMGKSVIDVYENTSDLIKKLHKDSEEMKIKIAEIEDSSRVVKLGRVETLNYYPPIMYAGNTPLVVFKEITSCRYFSNFVLAYKNHLETVRNKRVRLIFIVGKQPNIKNKYNKMFELTKDNYQSANAITNTVSYTTTPLKIIIQHMTRQSDEIILIVDRTYEKDSIIKGKAKVFYGVSSLNEVKREGLEESKCIFSSRGTDNALATISHIQGGFPEGQDNRFAVYERTFNKDFNRIDDILNVFKI